MNIPNKILDALKIEQISDIAIEKLDNLFEGFNPVAIELIATIIIPDFAMYSRHIQGEIKENYTNEYFVWFLQSKLTNNLGFMLKKIYNTFTIKGILWVKSYCNSETTNTICIIRNYNKYLKEISNYGR